LSTPTFILPPAYRQAGIEGGGYQMRKISNMFGWELIETVPKKLGTR